MKRKKKVNSKLEITKGNDRGETQLIQERDNVVAWNSEGQRERNK